MYLYALAPWRETFLAVLSLSVALVVGTALADDVAVQTVLSDLHSPCGVAVRPGGSAQRHEVLVSDTAAGRIVKVWSNEPGASAEVVTGFSTSASATNPLETAGPRGLLFLALNHVVVVGGEENAKPWVRLYALPDDNRPLAESDHQQQLIADSQSEADDGGGNNFYGLVRTRANQYVPDLLVVTATGEGNCGWLGKAALRAGTLGELAPFLAKGQDSEMSTPTGIAVSERGYLVVSQLGTLDKPRDSVLVFYSPLDGSTVLKMPAELHDVVALAYSPVTGNLYAADFAAAEPNDGGVYRIDDASRPGRPACQAVRVAKVARPTALAFGPDGSLYVTAFGRGNSQGTLVKLNGEL